MELYPNGHPRHSHRSPAELAEDERIEALHGVVCAPPATAEAGPPTTESVLHTQMAVLPWADAHPLGVAPAENSPDDRAKRVPTGSSRFRQLFRPGISFKLLLAIENDDNARTAVRVADALTGRGAMPSVVSAAEIVIPPPGTPDSMELYAKEALGEDFHYHRRRSLQNLIAAATGKDKDWPIASLLGDPSLCIIDEAEVRHSELIVMGIHQHGAFEQAIGENTATRVMGRAAVPVLGVRPALTGLPRRIMVAIDFGDASREAAHIAANLADPGGRVILVHASLPSRGVGEGDEGAALVQREGIEHAFLHLAEEISSGKSIRVETLNRAGDAVGQLMAAATLISPDLIAIASQRHHLLTRLMLGSVTRKLTRDGCWPMLVTPPAGR